VQVFINGQFVTEEQATVSVFDRSFLYGDGLFETLYFANRVVFRFAAHWERLVAGAAFLKVVLPYSGAEIRRHMDELIQRNRTTNGLLRLTLSRGVGVRGYSPSGANKPTLVMSVHPAPDRSAIQTPWKLVTSSFRLPANEPLALFKTCNKLPQVLARAEADASGAQEALLLNTDGNVVEASSSNLFWMENASVCTAPLSSGVLAGVTRSVVLELCAQRGLKACEKAVTTSELRGSDGVFLSLSSFGIVAAGSLDGVPLKQHAMINDLREIYWQRVNQETLSARS